ncbi:ATP-binding cassette domain-containing protein [Streptomyces sp. BRA346]|uniref:ATP-binding cassette domain-containing protein n=1 Tax=Streptomyces sp. BRA346 TaxID=2878199 RepID=UPI004064AE68
MIQATGLTSARRRNHAPAVDDLTFEAPPRRVTALLGGPGAGKTSALRLLLQLDRGQGSAFFRGRPLHRIRRPAREIGVLLDDVPGHPGRTVRGHLRMLGAAAGVPATRADVVLDVVGLTDLADERLGDLALGMERRLGIATALLGDPHALVLDEPARGLSARETDWLNGLLRGFADQGGAVLITTEDAEGVVRVADRVLTLEEGRLVADQSVDEFARTRLRPRVVVRSPLAGRLAAVLEEEAHAAREAAEVERRAERAAAAEAAARAQAEEAAAEGEAKGGIKLKATSRFGGLGRAKDTTQAEGDTAPAGASAPEADAEPATVPVPVPGPGAAAPVSVLAEAEPEAEEEAVADPFSVVRDDETRISVYGLPSASVGEAAYRHGIVVHRLVEETADLGPATPAGARARAPETSSPRVLHRLRLPGPAWPMRYELRRATGVRSSWLIGAAALALSLLASVLLARDGGAGELHRLTGWPTDLPLPPIAIAAGLLGALAFGDEFRYPALAPARDAVPQQIGLLAAKFVVCAVGATLLSLGAIVLDSAALLLLVGGNAVPLPSDWPVLMASVFGLTIGCSWAGLLAAGVFRSTALGLATLLAVPLLAVPVVRRAMDEPSLHSLVGLPHRLRAVALDRPPSMLNRGVAAVLRLAGQPVGQALMLSVAVLLFAYALTGLRGRRARQ